MIKVIIGKDESGNIESLKVSGHANYAEHGSDIVCAGVSAIVVGGINAINNKKSFDISVKSGDVVVKKNSDVSYEDKIILSTIETQLMSIQESYPKFIKIEIK